MIWNCKIQLISFIHSGKWTGKVVKWCSPDNCVQGQNLILKKPQSSADLPGTMYGDFGPSWFQCSSYSTVIFATNQCCLTVFLDCTWVLLANSVRSRMKGDKLYQKISHFIETLRSRLIHDIIVNECILSLSSRSGRLLTIGIFTFLLSQQGTPFSLGKIFFHIFFLTVNISTLRKFLEPSHLNFFSHLIT